MFWEGWCLNFATPNPSSMAKTMFSIPEKCVKNNQLQDFQFQLLHRYLPTNQLLYKMEKISTASCTLCNLYAESIIHLFYDCVSVKCLWMYVETLLEKLESRKIKLKSQDVILGFGINRKDRIFYTDINKLMLYAKYYIWTSRKNCGTVQVNDFVTWLRDFYNVDKSLEPIIEVM